MSSYHYHDPVLFEEAISYLVVHPEGVYCDGTLGGGGHFSGILEKLNKHGTLIGIDRDPEAVQHCRERFKKSGSDIHFYQGAFGDIERIVQKTGVKLLDGLLLDLGISSRQIDHPARGFSYLKAGPLDMRMDTQASLTAYDILHSYSEAALADLFFYYGEERKARRIAKKIVISRNRIPLETTLDLANLVRTMIPGHRVNKSLSRIFQALRIEVNDELAQLKSVLIQAGDLLNSRGRLVVIAYHSLEDRLVKRFLKGEELSFLRQEMAERVQPRQFRLLTKKVVRPSSEEVERNSRARSARLRAAEKL